MAAMPGIVNSNGLLIWFEAAVGYFMLFIGCAYLLQVPLLFSPRYRWRSWVFAGVIVLGVVLFVLNVIFIEPAQRVETGMIVYYLVQEHRILRFFVGAFPLFIGLVGVAVFAQEGLYLSREAHSFELSSGIPAAENSPRSGGVYRAYVIATGMSLLLLGGVFNFIVYIVSPTGVALNCRPSGHRWLAGYCLGH